MKKKLFTICLIVTLLVVSFVAGFSVTKSRAVVAQFGFGGRLIAWFPCKCSASLWLFYAPLGAPSPFPGGPLNYAPYSTLTYSFYNMKTPGVWHLGTYIPGAQGCWILVPIVGCVPLPVLGNEIMVGTSLKPIPSAGKAAGTEVSGTPAEVQTPANSITPEGINPPAGQAVT